MRLLPDAPARERHAGEAHEPGSGTTPSSGRFLPDRLVRGTCPIRSATTTTPTATSAIAAATSTGAVRAFATGLRNPNGMGWQPQSGALWTAVNERDELGSDLVPDYMTAVKDGGFYGWPYSYYGQHIDTRVHPQNPGLVATALVPDYALGPHTASLGLAFYDAHLFSAHYANGAFIGQHGSWNRKPRSGYKVIFVPFADGMPSGPSEDVLTGFLDQHERARGRPVGVVVDRTGALLVADDVGNAVWRVTPASASPGN